MRLLFDTNVVLDVLLKREPWSGEASALWAANDEGRITGFIAASTLTDIFYVARRLSGLEKARDAVNLCMEAFEICAVDRQIIENAYRLDGDDLEDNVQIACASLNSLDGIVTRDKDGFADSAVPVYAPSEVLKQLNISKE